MREDLYCVFATTAAIVLGELFLGSLIAIIVLATSPCDITSSSSSESVNFSSSSSSSSPVPPEPPVFAVYFSEYTAGTYTVTFFKEAPSNFRIGLHVRENVFNEFKWFQETIYDGEVFSRVFSTDDDDSVTICSNFSTHVNCYRQTNRDRGGFRIPYDVQNKQMGVPCYEVFPDLEKLLPSRKLDKCDLYGTSGSDPNVFSLMDYSFSNDMFLYWLVESGTNYPVMKQLKQSGEGFSTMTLYTSFKPGKPNDESGLKPLPGATTVYDFRDGEGDVDDCKFDLHASLEKHNPKTDPYAKSLRQTNLVQTVLNSHLFGVLPITPSRVRDSAVVRDISSIPKEFDARSYWPACADIIGTITNQDICGSCWAMASAGVLSDRLCISKGINEQLSPQYMVYCGTHSNGCQGGVAVTAWDDLIEEGTVSESCVPFTARFGECPDVCKDYSEIDYTNKVHPTGYVFPWGDTNESRVQAIQSEIMTNGPVLASFLAFDDWQSFFDYYPEGVYHRSKEATDAGGHAVRIIGWGTTEEGEDYWLVANSYGESFADNGVFKIRRGVNECNIEGQVGGLIL